MAAKAMTHEPDSDHAPDACGWGRSQVLSAVGISRSHSVSGPRGDYQSGPSSSRGARLIEWDGLHCLTPICRDDGETYFIDDLLLAPLHDPLPHVTVLGEL